MARPLWAEQDPDDWWQASTRAIQGVLQQAGVGGTQVKGIGLSGQMHGLVLLDEATRVIRPALIWCDQRSQSQVDFVNRTIGLEKILSYTANPVLTGFTLPKLLWVRDHDAASYKRIRHFLLPKDYVRFKLTGEFATDVSDASGTAMFDVVHRRWSMEMLDGLGIDRSIMPVAHESSAVSGEISKAAAELTGLAEGTPVVAGAGDQAASAVGNGIVEPGTVSCTVGTSGVVFAYLAEPAYDPAGRVHTFCHAIPNVWHVMGVTQGAGLSFQWFRNQLAGSLSYDNLTAEASLSPAGAQGLFWLPYLMGERTPHLDPTARGAWVGLTASHQRSDLIRALLEGVSFSQRDCLDIIAELGADPKLIRLSGGGAKSTFWHQLFADIFNKPVATLASQEGSAYGAALLSLVGTEEYGSVQELSRVTVHEVETRTPQPDKAALYARHHVVYKLLYPALKPAFDAISKLDA